MRMTEIKDPATLKQFFKVMSWLGRPGTGVYSMRFQVTGNGLAFSKNYEDWVIVRGTSEREVKNLDSL